MSTNLSLGERIRRNLSRGASQTLGWCVKRYGRTDLRRNVSILTFVIFLPILSATLILAIMSPDFLIQKGYGALLVGTLTNLLAASLISVIAALLWLASAKYRELEFTIHTFNYAANDKVGRKRKRLALEISESMQNELSDPSFSIRHIEDEDESILLNEMAAEFASHNTGHIAIVPFTEMARGIGRIFGKPSVVRDHAWVHQSEVELARTFAIFVTYDPRLEEVANCVKNLRFFSTPLIDVAAMFNDMIDCPGATHIVLLRDQEGDFQEVERALRDFVDRKVARLKRLELWTNKPGLVVLDAENYSKIAQKGDQVCVFVMSVDPSQEALSRTKAQLEKATSCGATIADIYVPPTWLRNWTIDDSEKHFIAYWDQWLGGRSLTTALPEGIALDKVNWIETGPCFDIIIYYTRHAIDLAKAVRKETQARGGTRYAKTADELDQIVQSVLCNRTINHDCCFLAAFRNGDVFYEPVIVKFAPNGTKTNFSVVLGKRPPPETAI